jgi:hypothetical protein
MTGAWAAPGAFSAASAHLRQRVNHGEGQGRPPGSPGHAKVRGIHRQQGLPGSCNGSVQMLPNMFNRCAMYAEEACESALVYPVVAEQEELLSLFDRSQGRFFRGSNTDGPQR